MSKIAILLALVAAALAGIVGNIAASILEKHLNSSNSRFRFFSRRLKLLVSLALFLLLSAPAIYLQVEFQSVTSDTTFPVPTPNSIPIAQENEILVVLAEFKNESHLHYDIEASVKLAIDEGLQQCAQFAFSDTKIRFERSNQTFERTQIEDVRNFGRNYLATIVIWGYYDDAGIFPFFTIIPTEILNIGGALMPIGERASPSPDLDNLTSPANNVGFYVHRDIPKIMTFLTELTLGQVLSLRGDDCIAQSYVDAAINTASGIDDNTIKRDLEIAYVLKTSDIFIGKRILGQNQDWYEEAMIVYTKLIELNPTAEYYYGRGVLNEEYGRHEDAIADLTKCFELMSEPEAPYSPPSKVFYIGVNEAYARHLRGKAYLETGKAKEALVDLNRSISMYSEDTVVYVLRGYAYQDLGDFDKAIQDFTHVIETGSINTSFVADAYGNRGLSYASQGKTDLAMADYDRAIELDNSIGGLYYNRAQLFFGEGNFDKAIDDYSMSIFIRPNHARSYHMRGQCYSSKQQLDAAIADYTMAIEIDPTVATFFYDRALDYLARAEYDEAITDCTKAIELAPSYSQSYLVCAQANVLSGNNQDAINDYKKLLEFETDQKLRDNVESQIESLVVK